MKSFIKLINLLFTIIVVSSTYGQNVGRSYKDIALDYMKEQKNFNGSVSATKADVHHFTNGNVVVDLRITRTFTVREEYTVPNGGVINYMDEYGQIKSTNKAHKDYNESASSSYKVFISKSGEPLKYLSPKGGYNVKYLSNSVWIFEYGNSKEVGGNWLPKFDNIKCYSSEGTLVKEVNDLILYSVCDTPNYLYLVGEINTPNGTRSIVRTINRKTNVSKDKLGELGEIDYNLEFIDKGISIDKQKTNGSTIRYIIPYEAEDESFQVQRVMQGHDLTTPKGQILLGERYLKGDILKKDEKKAFKLFEKAASKNNQKALFRIAQCYQNGWGVTQNISNAISTFEKCANLGYTDAMITLSDIYVEGKGISKDLSKGLYWKEKLAFEDNMDAQKFLIDNASIEYTHTNITAYEALQIARKNKEKMNYSWARFCYERAISLGNKDAIFELGEWLIEGTGIGKDNSKAIKLLSGLGEEGNVNAQRLLTQIYGDNLNTTADSQKAMYWLVKAADNGDTDSQIKLGSAYLNGDGVKKDIKLSAEWYEKAAKQNNQEAIKITFFNYLNGNGFKKDIEKAIYYYTRLKNNFQLELADNIFNGIGTKKNEKLAVSMYNELNNNGNIIATKRLALCYLYGYGVKKDVEIAYQLAMNVRNTTHDGEDGDIYFIEAKYLEKKYNEPNGRVVDCYRNAIKLGCSNAINHYVRYQRKYGLRLDNNGYSY